VAGDYVSRIQGKIETLEAQTGTLMPRLSKATQDVLGSSSVNGDLFWSAKDMVRNLNLMAAAITVDDWSPRPIRNQNDLFVQPMLIKARTVMDSERHLADAASVRLLLWAGGLLCVVLLGVAFWTFRPMEKAIRRAFTETTTAL